ncbi:hypothetical protein HUW63_30060 [Myxococcus sp. AM001]|nr:hypothetical protein [Myxococcus sp. AM001]
MKVEIHTDVLADRESWHLLDRLVDSFVDGRHFWHIADEDTLLNSPWLSEEPHSRTTSRNIEAFQKYLTAIDRSPPPQRMHRLSLIITHDSTIPAGASPQDARHILEEKAYVVVENAESDGVFLRTMMNALGRMELRETHDKHWWETDHAGGAGEFEKRVTRLIQKGIPRNRILILADSDRLFPGHRSSTVELLERLSKDHGVTALLLHKREIENYLPVSVLQGAHQKKTYRAFLSLTQEQRDYYDLKEGFKRHRESKKPIIPPEQEALFMNIQKKGRHVLEALCGGFGGDVWRLFQSKTMPPDQDAVRLTCTTCPDEIDTILDQIEGLL